jgi:hypothetical protein
VKIYFACPVCQQPARWDVSRAEFWQCFTCDHLLPIPSSTSGSLDRCAICANQTLYKKKDFPHWLGLIILTAACIGFLITNAFYWQWLAWTILIGSAVIDGLLYLTVKDAVVCYRCAAHYRGIPPGSPHKPFDLGTAERFRQERMRREQIKTNKSTEY